MERAGAATSSRTPTSTPTGCSREVQPLLADRGTAGAGWPTRRARLARPDAAERVAAEIVAAVEARPAVSAAAGG